MRQAALIHCYVGLSANEMPPQFQWSIIIITIKITMKILVSTLSVAVLTPQTFPNIYFQTLPSRAIPQEYETTAALWSLPMTIGSFITFALVANTHIDLFNAWRVHNALQEQFPVPWWRNAARCGSGKRLIQSLRLMFTTVAGNMVQSWTPKKHGGRDFITEYYSSIRK